MTRQSALSIATAVLIVLAGLDAGVVVAGTTAGTTTADSQSTEDPFASDDVDSLSVAVGWNPDAPDEVRYVYRFEPTADASFSLAIDDRVASVEGFTRNDDGTWQYDSSADVHRVTVVQSVSAAAERNDWVYGADHGVFVTPPRLRVRWTENGRLRAKNPLRRDHGNVDVSFGDRAGFREYRRIYVGPYTTYEATYGGTTYTALVPALADGSDDRYGRAIREVASMRDHLPFDDGRDHAEFVVFPDGEGGNASVRVYSGSSWAGRVFFGAPEAIVEDDVGVAGYDSTWAHEYVHVEQQYGDGPETDWLREAQAEYLTATNAHRVGCDDGDLASFIEAASSTRDDVLSDASTWASDTPYEKGLAVLSALSARLHAQSDGSVRGMDLFAAMEDGAIDDHAAFVDAVNDTVGDADLNADNARYLDRFVTTGDYPAEVDHPPFDRAPSCLGGYQHVAVTKTTYGSTGSTESTATPSPTPTATATPTATPTPTPTPTSTPTPGSTPTPTPTPTGDGGGSSGAGNVVVDWVEYATSWVEGCRADGSGVRCG